MKSRLRVGDRIRVNGKEGTVVSVVYAKDVLYGMGEAEAQVFGDNQRSMLGEDWFKKFYRVGVRMDTSTIEWFDCHEIGERISENKP